MLNVMLCYDELKHESSIITLSILWKRLYTSCRLWCSRFLSFHNMFKDSKCFQSKSRLQFLQYDSLSKPCCWYIENSMNTDVYFIYIYKCIGKCRLILIALVGT